MGMEVVGTTQVRGAEAPAKPVNQGGAPVAAVVPATPAVKNVKTSEDGSSEQSRPQDGQATEKQVQAAIEHVNKASKMSKTRCEFSYHEATKRVSIKVLDDDTGDVIREIPPEKSLEMVEKMWELAGMVVDEKR